MFRNLCGEKGQDFINFINTSKKGTGSRVLETESSPNL